jgi:hypothetical protein
MAFICKKRNREGREYVYLVENYRAQGKTKQRILKNYGALEVLEMNDPDIFEKLKASVRAGKQDTQAHEETGFARNVDIPLSSIALRNYGWGVLFRIYRELGLESYIGGLGKDVAQAASAKGNLKGRAQNITGDKLNTSLKLAVFSWILGLSAKTDATACASLLFGQNGFADSWRTSKAEMTRSLARISPHTNEIMLVMEKGLTAQKTEPRLLPGGFRPRSSKQPRLATFVNIDVTNYLGKDYGNTIVQIGMMVDSATGIPICYHPFYGGKVVSDTYQPTIKQMKLTYGIDRVVATSDLIHNSNELITTTYNNGNGWLYSDSLTSDSDPELKEFALHRTEWRFSRDRRFAVKSYIRERMLTNGITVAEKVLITWSKELSELDRAARNGETDILNSKSIHEAKRKAYTKFYRQSFLDNKTGQEKMLHPYLGIFHKDDKDKSQFDGMTAIVTSEVKQSDEKLLRQHREIWTLEENYRVARLRMLEQPDLFANEANFLAFSLNCFIAFKIIRVLRYRFSQSRARLKFSEEDIVEALNSAQTTEIGQDYWIVFGNNKLAKIHEALGIDWTASIISLDKLARYVRGQTVRQASLKM